MVVTACQGYQEHYQRSSFRPHSYTLGTRLTAYDDQPLDTFRPEEHANRIVRKLAARVEADDDASSVAPSGEPARNLA